MYPGSDGGGERHPKLQINESTFHVGISTRVQNFHAWVARENLHVPRGFQPIKLEQYPRTCSRVARRLWTQVSRQCWVGGTHSCMWRIHVATYTDTHWQSDRLIVFHETVVHKDSIPQAKWDKILFEHKINIGLLVELIWGRNGWESCSSQASGLCWYLATTSK